MSYILVHHQVEDYARWKPLFDQNGAARKAHGSKGSRVLRSAENPNDLVLVMEWDSLENARKFAESPELREVMGRAGVIGRPEVFYLEEADRQSA